MIRRIAAALLVLVVALGYFAWKRYAAPPQAASTPPTTTMPPASEPPAAGGEQAANPGVAWKVPARWVEGGPRPMRLATYTIGDAECAVFYFGPNQGGAVDDNIDRWVGQFQGSPNPRREVRDVHGLHVTRVEIDGTFLAPGADMQSQGSKPGWRLLGAIVQGPQGPVFFKLTGPAGTVRGATRDFEALLASLTAH